MKKQLLWVIILPLLILSCTIAEGGAIKGRTIYDESVPSEKTALINISVLGTVTGYNGITVNWKNSGRASNIQIPAGDTLLEVDVDATPGFVHYTGKGMIFQYNFQPGKYYLLRVGEDKTGDVGVHINSWSFGEKMGLLSEENYEAFTPFLNEESNVGVGEQIILE
jgi:hypothetical protein